MKKEIEKIVVLFKDAEANVLERINETNDTSTRRELVAFIEELHKLRDQRIFSIQAEHEAIELLSQLKGAEPTEENLLAKVVMNKSENETKLQTQKKNENIIPDDSINHLEIVTPAGYDLLLPEENKKETVTPGKTDLPDDINKWDIEMEDDTYDEADTLDVTDPRLLSQYDVKKNIERYKEKAEEDQFTRF